MMFVAERVCRLCIGCNMGLPGKYGQGTLGNLNVFINMNGHSGTLKGITC